MVYDRDRKGAHLDAVFAPARARGLPKAFARTKYRREREWALYFRKGGS
jgi:hypothetical protein